MKVWSPADGDDKFELTSMIDVVFLLIAFFMTVTSFASADLIQVVMPLAPEAKVPEEVGDRQYISVAENGNYFLGAHLATLDEIKIALIKRAENPGFRGAYIRADASTPHKYVSDLMKACSEVGVNKILFGTLQE